ncbi:ABC transporter permease [Amycolatopsis saalfeldensis]|uniref:ABC transporter permease n=1 Tax=Amycolatopsis saalfeldensis TaxID=394193 RepID=UPI001FE62412|nr:ABC transporter permease [Amycolatopsis saalfeldensis]
MFALFPLSWQMIRAHRAGFAAAFVAVFFGSALITVCGVLIDSGQRAGIAPERYAAVPVVVTAPQSVTDKDGMAQRFAERVPLPASEADAIARVPGVRSAIGDVSVPAGLRTAGGTTPLTVHGWSATGLGPIALADGRAPAAPDEVVLDAATAARASVRTGDAVDLEAGSVATRFRVAGTTVAGAGPAFLTDARARQFAGRPDQVDAVGVLAQPGVDAGELATRIQASVPGVVAAAGNDRADAEFLDVGTARSFLVLIAASFGGTMLMIVLLVVASTLGLSVQQRRRQFALLRAIAATPRQLRRLIGTEAVLVSAVASVLGAPAGLGLSLVLRNELADLGVVPAGFRFVYGPLPIVAAVAACVLTALGAGLVAARRAARISPIAALGEAAVEPPRLGRGRLVTGWVLVVAGVLAGGVVPLVLAGPAAIGGAAGSVLLLVIAVALLGPRLLTATSGLFRGLGLGRGAAGYLAGANTRAHARRLGSATTPLIMGVALAAVQIFTLTTTAGAAQRQADAGLVADRVLVAENGVAPAVAGAVRQVPGVAAAVPVARTGVQVTYRQLGEEAIEPAGALGVTPEGLRAVLNLDVRRGDLTGLTGDTVAVSQFAADTYGVDVGGTLNLRLGDGTPHPARVVAVYGSGLGFGDLTLPHDVVVSHTTSRLDTEILVAKASGIADAALDAGLHKALAAHPEVRVSGREAFAGGQDAAAAGQSTFVLLLNLVLLGFIAIAVVNILVLATAARVREFALLRLVGAKPRQVRSMMRREAGVVVVASVVLGSLAALPPLLGVSVSLTGSPLPTVPLPACLAIAGVAAVLGWASIAIPTRFALRPAPMAALRTGE